MKQFFVLAKEKGQWIVLAGPYDYPEACDGVIANHHSEFSRMEIVETSMITPEPNKDGIKL